mmetsp:Transcript_10271/g.24499  ORF Transcript_10271/g.24499 Transcript_10271/m.24499 type:complete len:485 (+) Transcript_10271:84-1538(+)|eukprot:CAMPEP_0177592210 /NCGR_PEP_ID=MMETSP0419_2-20121207/8431_1 /TAXON_ID=582737 /ORGANISM="Tetraselmis sp., Strain GSL018" /LENGTH=484 /DNA_ID=CAMNT_0019083047 /DNA_START=18 /DNA_END=1472 /DNA_ORIENTATION=+
MILDKISLTPSGRPVLFANEIEQISLEPADIFFEGTGGVQGDFASEYKGGLCRLTTHRLLWICEKTPARSWGLDLRCVQDVQLKTKIIGSPSLRVLVPLDASNRTLIKGASGVDRIGQLKIKHGGTVGTRSYYMDDFVKALKRGLEQKAWQADSESKATALPGTRADPDLLQAMQAMGFQASSAAHALVRTGNTGVEQAVSWLMEHKEGAAEAGKEGQEDNAERPGAPAAATPLAAGISGILRRQQEEANAADAALKTAFADLSNLEAKARELVDLAERFRNNLAKRPSEEQTGSAEAEAQASMLEELVSMGIASPVTKESAGRQYHKELSRQLSDFLTAPLERAGGLMTLQEVYCLFNRARGTELVSPDDLMEAVKLFPFIKSPLRLRLYESGVKAVSSESLDYTKVSDEILALVQPEEEQEGLGLGITEIEAARRLNVSVMVAREHILAAEKRGVLCRDDSPEGLRFFYNFFKDLPAPILAG